MTTTVKYNPRRAAYCCMHCYMLSRQLLPQCQFCGATYSNYQEILVKNWHEQEVDEMEKLEYN